MAEVRGGLHYPRSIGEFQAWFRTDADCLDYLEWLRWPHGFECARCDGVGGWRTGDRRIMCAACGHRTSVTAGTIFDKTRTPLTVWFTACWSFATAKDGISALSLQRSLEIGSYQTAWAMLARFRSVLVHPGRKRLNGTVEVDETYIGGEEPGLAGGRAQGKKVLTGIAVEVREPKGIGRCRMALLEDGSAASLLPFVTDHVAPAATVITDAWMGYHGLARLGYAHRRRSQRAARARGEDPATLLPAVHRVASLAKRWLLSTHQGAVEPPTCRATSMSLCSASTAGARAAAAWSSTVCSSLRPVTSRCATAASLPGTSHGRPHQCRLLRAGIRRAWTESPPGICGALRICHLRLTRGARTAVIALGGDGRLNWRGRKFNGVSPRRRSYTVTDLTEARRERLGTNLVACLRVDASCPRG